MQLNGRAAGCEPAGEGSTPSFHPIRPEVVGSIPVMRRYPYGVQKFIRLNAGRTLQETLVQVQHDDACSWQANKSSVLIRLLLRR